MKINLDLIADFGVLPMRVVDDNNEISEVIVADTISGGRHYKNEMPNRISLTRTFKDGREIRQIYEQKENES